MSTNTIMTTEDQIKAALREGYGITGDIRIQPIAPGDTGRYEVWVGEKWFGIWDVERKTFVE